MATNNSTAKRGGYICKHKYYDIYQKYSYQGEGKKRRVTSHSLDIYHAKSLVKGGFKTKQQAFDYIESLNVTNG
jgi:hypothetical protein